MLSTIFSKVLNMSLTGSVVILAVYLARLFLKNAPKIYSYLLWGLVLFRLLCPVSIFSSFSLIPEPISTGEIVADWEDDYVGSNRFYHDSHAGYAAAIDAGRTPVSAEEGHYYIVTGSDGISEPKTVENTLFPLMATIWSLGIAGMFCYSIASYFRVRRLVQVAVPYRKNVYIADDITTAFVMGFFPPVIYLPGSSDRREWKYIIAHERHHIRRGDPIFKALGFFALSLHWFNPLVWLAFILANRDMEMSCDEAVIQKYGESVRSAYSAALLNLSTGHRLFFSTPLAFGEGNTTDRVRNIAKWKKPSFWIVLLCAALCILLSFCLLTNPETQSPENASTETEPASAAESLEERDWGVSLVPNRVSRTGATAQFSYDGRFLTQEGVELTYGDFLSLEQKDGENWIPCDELAGYEYFVSDASHPVVDGYGMVHEWQDRFGELVDGHYRIGKLVTLTLPDGTSQEQMVYGKFSIPESIQVGLIPMEDLPERYSQEQAMIDGCFVQEDGIARYNKERFQEFVANANNGIPGIIRIYNCHYGEEFQWSVADLAYDANQYTLTSQYTIDERNSYSFRYLKHYTGEKAWENAEHDAFEYYILVNDDTLTWQDIHSNILDMGDSQNPPHWTVYSDFTYAPKQPQLPGAPGQVTLEFAGESLVTTTDFDRLEKIWILFQDAEFLGYEPKTHNIGGDLNLILTSQDGESILIELDPDSDICRINGEFVFYGAYDEPDYIEKLWYYLDIPAWPEQVYETYPNAYRP